MGEKIQMKNFCGGVVVPEQHGVKNFFFFSIKKNYPICGVVDLVCVGK